MTNFSFLGFTALSTLLMQAEEPNPAPARDIDCQTLGRSLGLEVGVTTELRCPANCPTQGTLWGSRYYTDDSPVCLAAVHSGQITQEGGTFPFTLAEGQQTYVGSERNGVRSSDYGPFGGSFVFGPLPEPSPILDIGCGTTLDLVASNSTPVGTTIDVRCPSDCSLTQAVWGSAIYTSDSGICKAAIHAGTLTIEGGVTQIRLAPGQDSYEGSSKNGVSTLGWRQWGRSFIFRASNIPDGTLFLNCEDTAQNIERLPGDVAPVYCPEGCANGRPPWGTDIYTDDSPVCRAAIHAGALSQRGGVAYVGIMGLTTGLSATSRNNIESKEWPIWHRNYRFISP